MLKKLINIIRSKPWLSIIALIYLAGMIAVSIPKSAEINEDSDFYIYWQAGKDFSAHNEMYYREKERPFTYPPFAAFVFQPLQFFSLQTAALIFFLLNALVLMPLALYLVYRILIMTGLSRRKAGLALILSTVFMLKYFWNNLMMFQVNMVLFIVILIGIYYITRRKPCIAGVLFTVITLIKIIPVFLAAYVFLFHFSRRVFVSMLLTAVICLSLPIAFRGASQWVTDHKDHFERFLKPYIVEGKIVTDPVNHGLKAGMVKAFHPESRKMADVYPEDFPVANRIASIVLYLFIGILLANGIILKRRKVYFSLAYFSSILLFTHLYAGITWTAHLVTMMLCLLPVLIIDRKKLNKPWGLVYWIFIAFMVFLGIEGSDTTGKWIYQAIHYYDIYTVLLLGLFLFTSWAAWYKKPGNIYPDGVQV